jgi:pSer/pThr/pTyr-binding forkhead associated (FHA) protein
VPAAPRIANLDPLRAGRLSYPLDACLASSLLGLENSLENPGMPAAPPPLRPVARHRLALRFISGKYQGGEFPLEPDREIIVGRSSDLDMVLVEEMVSRKHARIEHRDGQLMIEDLGSTNGTFVNGERIAGKTSLSEGDRVLIGSNILRVVPSSTETGAPVTRRSIEPPGGAARVPRRTETEGARMTGSIEEIPLPDLLQLFGTSRKTGVLVLGNEVETGRIFLDGGVIQHASIESSDGDESAVLPLKAIYRMLTWDQGTFELQPPSERKFETPLGASVHEVLMEGFRQRDEFEHLKPRLPTLETLLQAELPLELPLRALEPAELDVFQAVLNGATFKELLDVTPLADLDAANALMTLIEKGYVTRPG